MSDEKLKLPRSSYEELVKIIRAYGRSSGPAGLDEIASLSGLGRTIISANNAFLVAVEVIEGAKTKSPTQKGLAVARALEHEMPDQVSQAWTRVVTENDFLNKMVQAVSIRKGMEAAHFENHIAYSAGESKSKGVMTGARAVIDILKESGLVREEGGQILPEPKTSIGTRQQLDTSPASSDTAPTVQTPSGVALNIQVRIDASVDELDGLGEKLRDLINSISESGSNRPRESDQQQG